MKIMCREFLLALLTEISIKIQIQMLTFIHKLKNSKWKIDSEKGVNIWTIRA